MKYSSQNIYYSEHSSVYYLQNHKLKHATQMSDHASHESIKSGANVKKILFPVEAAFVTGQQ